MASKLQSAYLSFGADLRFEAVTSEGADHTAKVTEHPVEEGANVTDHIRNELDTITLDVFVSNQPIRDVNKAYGLDLNYIELLDINTTELVVSGKTLDVPKYRAVPVAPGALIQTIGAAVADLFADDTVAQVYTSAQSAKISAAAQLLSWPTKFNAVTDVVRMLTDWKEQGVVGQVIMPWKTFNSMVITKVTTARDASTGDGAKVSISFKEIRLVESQLVTAPVPTENRGKTAVVKGRQPTSFTREPAPKKKSLLRKVTGG